MRSFSAMTEIDAAPDAVWPFAVEPDHVMQWQTGVTEIRVPKDGSTDQVGCAFETDIEEGRKVQTYRCEVISCEAPRLYVMTMRGGPFKDKGFQVRTELADVGGKTHVTSTCEFELDGFFMKLLAPLGAMFAKKQQRQFLGNLKRLVETGTVDPT